MEQEPYRVDARIELTKPPEPDAGIDWPAWIQAISPILLALVGLYWEKVTQTDARAAASTLSAFGPPAVAPLITALADADDVRTPAIEGALRAIGLSNAEAVCGPLLSILEHQTGRYSWLMQRSAIRVIGDVRCPSARTLLESYGKAVEDRTLKAFDPATETWTPLSPEILELLETDVDRALSEAR
jgi:hypothetical protein